MNVKRILELRKGDEDLKIVFIINGNSVDVDLSNSTDNKNRRLLRCDLADIGFEFYDNGKTCQGKATLGNMLNSTVSIVETIIDEINKTTPYHAIYIENKA